MRKQRAEFKVEIRHRQVQDAEVRLPRAYDLIIKASRVRPRLDSEALMKATTGSCAKPIR